MMRISSNRHEFKLISLIGLALGAHRLSARFYTSAAFERPILFTIVTLLISGAAFRCRQRWIRSIEDSRNPRPPREVLRAATTASPHAFKSHGIRGCIRCAIDTLQRLTPEFRTLLLCLVGRTLLFWYTLRKAQCSWRGIEAFLPFFCVVSSHITGRPIEQLPRPKTNDTGAVITIRYPLLSAFAYAFTAFAWGLASVWALNSSVITTGAVCPVGWRLEPFVPLLQALLCGLDGVILTRVAHLRREDTNESRDSSPFLSTLCFTVAGCVAVLAFLPIVIELGSLIWILRLDFIDIRDLVLDSCLATLVIVCAFALLESFQSPPVAIIAVGLGIFGFQIPYSRLDHWPTSFSSQDAFRRTSIMAALAALLIIMTRAPDGTSRNTNSIALHKWVKIGYVFVVGLCIARVVLFPLAPLGMKLDAAVKKLTEEAELEFGQWVNQASRSKTFPDAVTEYQERHRIPPPPNFDKWYEFARMHNSPIIDSFDQIHDDILPFWGVEPAEIRTRTAQALSHAILGIGALRIRGGVLEQSPHIPGTHRWMAESLERMIKPFAHWLPDMDLAFNLGDECRVAVPFEEKESLLKSAANAHTTLSMNAQEATLLQGWTKKNPLAAEWVKPEGDFYESSYVPAPFSNNMRKQLYYHWMAPTCPADSPARHQRWWDRSVSCIDCLAPQSVLTDEGAVMARVSVAADICHQPDLAYLSGFVMSPTVISTNKLFPIFSQSRVGGFSDILFPSPWNFDLKSKYEGNNDLDWADKNNALFWRGSSSDGYAWDGTWTGFLRARLVNEGYHQAVAVSTTQAEPVGVNVSFTGPIHKSHEADHHAELDTFRRWGNAALAPGQRPDEDLLPPTTPFDENWHYRHLIDMDGAGFSGRFIPFLQSRSLVHRAAIFKTWFDERLREWHHYVPVDVRLGQGFWSVLHYLGSTVPSSASERSGDEVAQLIAQRGRDWAAKALREEDMQIYMFRLLLEWGRVVDDNRESLGYRAG